MVAVSDVVILLPGISGSVLQKDGKTLWGPDLSGVWGAIQTRGDSIRSLMMHGDDPDLDDIDGVEATSLIPTLHIIPYYWKIDGYTKVREHLIRELGLRLGENYFDFPYDWRRDNRVASRKLGRFARKKLKAWRESPSGDEKAKLVFVAHSMGGLVARGFMDGNDQGWRDTRMLVTLGTPHGGSLSSLGYIANGYVKDVGPIHFDLSDTLRSFTGVYQLLPRYPVLDRGDGKLLRLGETEGLPRLDADRAKAAMGFYAELEGWHDAVEALPDYAADAPDWYPITGTFQETMQSATFDGSRVKLLPERNGKDGDGDGTVPSRSATPLQFQGTTVGMFADQVHGSLQNDDAVLKHVIAAIKRTKVDRDDLRGGGFKRVSLIVGDVYDAAEPVTLRARVDPPAAALKLDLYDARQPAGSGVGRLRQVTLYNKGEELLVGKVTLTEGSYRVVVASAGDTTPAADCFLVVAGGDS